MDFYRGTTAPTRPTVIDCQSVCRQKLTKTQRMGLAIDLAEEHAVLGGLTYQVIACACGVSAASLASAMS
jgi:hypothetical protein